MRVALGARTLEQIEEIASCIRTSGGKALAVRLDVTEPDSISTAVSQVEQHFGPVEILINNAGMAHFDDILCAQALHWREMFEVNVIGQLQVTQRVLPSMLRQNRGHVVMIASTSSHRAYAKQAGYCASKHALLGFSRVLLEELRETHVRVHLISPGGVNTDLARSTREDHVTEQYMDPKEVAESVHFVLQYHSMGTIDEIVLRRHKSSPML